MESEGCTYIVSVLSRSMEVERVCYVCDMPELDWARGRERSAGRMLSSGWSE